MFAVIKKRLRCCINSSPCGNTVILDTKMDAHTDSFHADTVGF